MTNVVYCLSSSEPQANSILTQMRTLGFAASDISIILPNGVDTKSIAVEEDALRGAKTGGLVGGVLGWLVGLSALAIPGVGLFMIAGPLAAAFGGAVAGGVVGGLAGGTGAVHPLGLPDDVRNVIEDRLRTGEILISLTSEEPQLRESALQVFRAAGASCIQSEGRPAAA